MADQSWRARQNEDDWVREYHRTKPRRVSLAAILGVLSLVGLALGYLIQALG